MEYDSDRMRGILDKSFPSVKLAFHRDSLAEDILTKCKENVWGEGTDATNYQYFLADGSGTMISNSSFNVDLPDGSKESLPWTLSNYLRVSNIRFPSRLRLYCMRNLSRRGNILDKTIWLGDNHA